MTIPDVVRDIISDILACDPEELRPDQHLIRDLHMDGDDASFLLVPELEKALGVKVPRKEWEMVGTIQDILDLMEQHRR